MRTRAALVFSFVLVSALACGSDDDDTPMDMKPAPFNCPSNSAAIKLNIVDNADGEFNVVSPINFTFDGGNPGQVKSTGIGGMTYDIGTCGLGPGLYEITFTIQCGTAPSSTNTQIEVAGDAAVLHEVTQMGAVFAPNAVSVSLKERCCAKYRTMFPRSCG